nr:MAG TPA: hypothetical protein [Caudoviricetes sp.]
MRWAKGRSWEFPRSIWPGEFLYFVAKNVRFSIDNRGGK